MIDLLRRRMEMGLMPTDIIINREWSDNDAALMDVIYAQGWSKSKKYMTKREAEAVTNIGDAFRENTAITSFNQLEYFTGLTYIVANAFSGCTSLEEVIIPEGVTFLQRCILINTLVRYIYIPKNVTKISSSFAEAKKLSYIDVDNSNKKYHSYKGLLYDSDTQTCFFCPEAFKGDVEIKEGTKKLQNDLFANKVSITSIFIPDGVEVIGTQAIKISNWGISTPQGTLRIPSSITSLGANFARGSGFTKVEYYSNATIPKSAFLSNTLIETFIIYNTEKIIDLELTNYGSESKPNYLTYHPFRDCYKLNSIYVPDELYDDYINSEVWKKGINLTTKMKKLSELPS